MSKYGVISGLYFPVFSPNTGKYGPEITPYLDYFHAMWISKFPKPYCEVGKNKWQNRRPYHEHIFLKQNFSGYFRSAPTPSPPPPKKKNSRAPMVRSNSFWKILFTYKMNDPLIFVLLYIRIKVPLKCAVKNACFNYLCCNQDDESLWNCFHICNISSETITEQLISWNINMLRVCLRVFLFLGECLTVCMCVKFIQLRLPYYIEH